MTDLITVVSHLPMAIRLHSASPPSEAAGDAPLHQTVVIAGQAGGKPGITTGVDAGLFRAWIEANPNHDAVASHMIYEVSEEEHEKLGEQPVEYGFEPGLERAKSDAGVMAAAARGTADVQDPGADDLKANSNPPSGDASAEPSHDGHS